jgi:NADPH:quinone reductase-like Zn-dependent oxidoreductase
MAAGASNINHASRPCSAFESESQQTEGARTMKLRSRVLAVVVAVVAIALTSGAITLSHDSPCGAPDPLPAGAERMKAILFRCYGSPEVLQLEEVAKPVAKDDQVLVKIHAASVNPIDWHVMRGSPYIMRLSSGLGSPDDVRVGVDFAGTVEAVGSKVTRFKPGDEVFGGRSGALAEYIAIREDRALTLKPANLTFEQAAAIPVAAITALQALRDKGQLQPGHRVLINGASGGVGTFAVQIAKALGAEVTGVCSTRNVALVRSLGADHVIDYTQENFTRNGQRYDLILDNVGNHSVQAYRRVMKPGGILVIVGGPKGNWIKPLGGRIKAALLSPFVDEKLLGILARLNQDDLNVLGELARAGKMTPVIDRRFSLSEAPAAIAYLEEGRARGKVIVSLQEMTPTR